VAVVIIIRTGLRPQSGDPQKWYDRVIRVVGGAIILLWISYGLIFLENSADK
jgi:hypothetical protein